MEPVDEHFLTTVRRYEPRHHPVAKSVDGRLLADLFAAQAESRHLDLAARSLQREGHGFYTIASAGHESNAAVGLLSRATDPALLHYRSGALYAARAARHGSVDAITETLRSLTCSAADPMSGGRHKVIGHPELGIVPQTSTIASHVPRAVGLAYALGLAGALGRATPWPEDAVVVCSFGDASLNHSTAVGGLNAASYLTHRRKPCPVLFVCEDNGIGISTRTPRGWTETALRHLPGIHYVPAAGHAAAELLGAVGEALDRVRSTRAPAVMHLRTVRFMGHAGSDVEMAYRSPRAIAADLALDPLTGTARALMDAGVRTSEQIVEEYEAVRARVAEASGRVVAEARLATRSDVMAPLAHRPIVPRIHRLPSEPPAAGATTTLAQAVNRTLAAQMERHDDVLVFGEDVAIKGGVYGVTRGLFDAHGAARVFDTLLDEQTILGTALGASLAGFVPVPEIQYLAYLHNAEDQLRGEAASLRFFSAGSYQNGMVVRIAGLAYQKGFGGHFHNDNSIAVLRDIPGLVLAVPSHPAVAPALLRECLRMARDEGRVCVYLEPIARYHTRDLMDGDRRWLATPDDDTVFRLGEVTAYGLPEDPEESKGSPVVEESARVDVLMVTFGNGVHMGRRVAEQVRADGISAAVLDLMWLSPLPVEALTRAARLARSVLVVDETRETGGVGEALVTALVENGLDVPLARVASADTFIPLGPAAATVLLQEDEIAAAVRRLHEALTA